MTDHLNDLRGDQRILAQFHSLPRLGNWKALMNFADINYTINQPLQEKEYKLPGLPNLIDPDEFFPLKRKGKITIAFAPTTRTPVGAPDSKGYYEVTAILKNIIEKRDINIDLIEGLSYSSNLVHKSRAHILIDDVITGNWHRTSLEGACFACAVINKVKAPHFIYADLDCLEKTLLNLIDKPEMLAIYQKKARLWVLQKWHAIDRVKEYTRAYGRLLNA